jgi:tetratricopeptide (TPR) repeat protein
MHALAGELGAVTLASVLQLVRADRLAGRLVLRRGWIGMREGLPVQAACGDLDGELALMELFVDASGPFHLDTDSPGSGAPLGDLIGLVMDGCRLSDEWERCRTQGVSVAPDVELPEHLESVRSDLVAGFALQVVARRNRVSGVELVETVLELVELEEATLVAASDPPLELDYYQALELGRAAYRAKEWPRAIQAFERALACRPDDRVAKQNLRATLRRAEESP